MRAPLLSAALLAAMFTGSFAYAEQTTGAIKSIDESAKTVTLENGTVFTLGDNTSRHEMLGGYLPGDTVTIVWSMEGTSHSAQSISPDFSSSVAGKIKAIDEANMKVTLEDGQVYSFHNEKDEKVALGGFKVGDDVAIVSAKTGDMNDGRSIAAVVPAEVTGKVKAIDTTEKTVTLEDGMVYSFHSDKGENVHLDGYKAGDMVKILAITIGSTNWGRAISPASS